ncbi:acetyl-CoA synthetase-like protein [Aspergillus ellipticus CBS 707.79]|uniref:Acetyl-CoA synthetase-like protein n=1 Tax=Aspergillus ellipticus CBS 707.79 TaxID=1448320 RepID=A0A319E4W4_9EURO|nr:acetyl-CoA synthetase-like protein [Aspergillus ellipticus CBS 707.79]
MHLPSQPERSSLTVSKWTTPIPRCSLPRFVFGSPRRPLSNRKVLIDADHPDTHSLSLAEYRLLSCRVAVGLHRLGVTPKDRVLCVTSNALCYPALLMGTVMAGGIFASGQPALNHAECYRLITFTKPAVIFASRATLPIALAAARDANHPDTRIFVFDDDLLTNSGLPEGPIAHWQTMLGSEWEGSRFWYPNITSPSDYNSTIMLLFTSGTTGSPKGVELSHRNYIASALGYMKRISTHPAWDPNPNPNPKLSSSFSSPPNPPDVRVLGSLAINHSVGQRSYCVIFPKMNVPLYLMRRNDYQSVCAAIERFQITDAIIRSSVLTSMAKNVGVCGRYDLSCLRRVEGCAAPMSQFTKLRLEAMGVGYVCRAWGLTETGTITGPDPLRPPKSETVGQLNATYEGKVTDSSDPFHILKTNEVGEIWIRTPGSSRGYWYNEAATEQLIGPGGWICTGDVGYVDDEGNWYIVDRKKDLIKVNGSHVSPVEIEAVLLQHPNVCDVGVIGVAVNEDEGPRAYIQTSPKTTVTAAEIYELVSEKLPPYKRLSGGLSFIEKIPRNASGKVLRSDLRLLAIQDLGDYLGNYHGTTADGAGVRL